MAFSIGRGCFRAFICPVTLLFHHRSLWISRDICFLKWEDFSILFKSEVSTEALWLRFQLYLQPFLLGENWKPRPTIGTDTWRMIPTLLFIVWGNLLSRRIYAALFAHNFRPRNAQDVTTHKLSFPVSQFFSLWNSVVSSIQNFFPFSRETARFFVLKSFRFQASRILYVNCLPSRKETRAKMFRDRTVGENFCSHSVPEGMG